MHPGNYTEAQWRPASRGGSALWLGAAGFVLFSLSCSGDDDGGTGSGKVRGLDAGHSADARFEPPPTPEPTPAADEELALIGAPFPYVPTDHGFKLNAVVSGGEPTELRSRVREAGASEWGDAVEPSSPTDDVAEWSFDGLSAGTRYEYQVAALADDKESVLYEGEVVTQRKPGAEYTFALITDTHIWPREISPGTPTPEDYMESTLQQVALEIRPARPDFVMNLGDMLDFHLFGFNEPPPEALYTRQAYLNYRRFLGDTLGHAAHFVVIGNWDGENGDFTGAEIDRSRSQRLLYAPGPEPDTYPEGGSDNEDYYAFTWGDALYVVLNVMTYAPTSHRLSNDPGVPDDWTLGQAQLDWLRTTLENAKSKWRFLLIHHAVGGAGGDSINAAYGRGGGLAARVGEQSTVHDLMLEHDVRIFFYGHDHVFTDIVVDGIHYSLPGSAGAPWKFVTEETGYTDYWSDSGHAEVHVSPSSVVVDFIAVEGELLYSYTLE